MEILRIDPVGKFLGSFYIGNLQKCVVVHTVINLFFVQLVGEQVMSVHIKLKAERRPCGNAQIAEPQLFVNEIKIVVEAFALVRLKESFPGHFIMPRLISITAFHCGKDMDKAFGFPSFENDFLDMFIFAENMEFTDEFNFNPIFRSDLFCILPDLFCKVLGETGIIKNADAAAFHICGHSR